MILSLIFFSALAGARIDEPETAFVGATLVDGTGAPPITDSVVLVRGKRIVYSGPKPSAQVPTSARIVDLHGKWLLPGLIDMHVHLDEDISPSAFPLFGVTSVRDVGSRLVTIQKLRARAAKGESMPRIYWMGRNIDESKPSWWGAVAVKGPEEVAALMEGMSRQGVDGVKLYTDAGPLVSKAVILDAHKRGWPVTGHLQKTKPSEASSFGIDNLEHVSTLFSELGRPAPKSVAGYLRGFVVAASVDVKDEPTRRLISILKSHGTAITPTLTVSLMPMEGERESAGVYRTWADLPAGWSKYWKSAYWSFISTYGWKAANFATAHGSYRKYMEMVKLLETNGIPIIAGTDTPAPWVLPGAGLIHELELLVDAGLTPMSAIQAATGRAAHILRREGDVGTIRPGRIADFVVLDADPLANIHNLRQIADVYKSGKREDRLKLRKQFDSATEPPPGKP